MTNASDLPAFATRFGPASRDDWRALVEKALNGVDFKRRLVAKTYDGLCVEPIYDRAAGASVAIGRSTASPWGITTRIDHPAAATAAALALADLEGGADGVALVIAGSQAARGYGLTIADDADLEACLVGVMPDLIQVRVEPHASADVTARRIAALCARRAYDPARLEVTFGFDPIRAFDRAGAAGTAWSKIGPQLARIIAELQTTGFKGPFIACDGRPVSEAGASEAQELAYLLAAGVAYGRALHANGMSVAEAYRCLSWTLAVDADQFLGIAKLRALRRLWARVEQASGVAQTPITIHAETAWRMLTRRDPAVNMLRATMATFAAAVGGADSIAVLPHTSALGLPDALSRRIARNTQLVLQEESHLWQVADPAAGSGAVEALTDELCLATWSLFQEVEREGGLVESLAGGRIQARIATVAATRARDIATRKAPLTGTSEFPNLATDPGGVFEDVPASQLAAAFLPSMRLAEPFEALRDAADAQTAASGARPKVYLANLGPLAEFGARAAWTGNLLAAGGIAVVSNDGFTASGAAAAAFAASGARAACICGADATYATLAEATAMALKSAGATHVMMAGKPGALEPMLTAAGVDQYLFAGQDVVAALAGVHRALGIAAG
jgi:methylmalonyl-CoA mutase